MNKILIALLLVQGHVPCHLMLPEYTVDPCLRELLVATAASNRRHYPASSYFYSLSFVRGNSGIAVTIDVDRWADTRDTDYVGLIKIDSVSFLIRGKVNQEALFTRLSSPVIEVTLQPHKGSRDDFVFIREPSLQGTYLACKGEWISLEIYTKGRIDGYQMQVQR